MYTMLNPKTGERVNVETFADMVNRWVCEPEFVMATVGLTPSEVLAVSNLYDLRDQLKAARQDCRVSHRIAEMRGDQIRKLTSVEGDVT